MGLTPLANASASSSALPFPRSAPTGRFTPCGTRTPYLMTQSLCPQNTQPQGREQFLALRLRESPTNILGKFTQLFKEIFVHSSRWTDDGSYMGIFFFPSCPANLWTSGAPFFPSHGHFNPFSAEFYGCDGGGGLFKHTCRFCWDTLSPLR